MKPRIIVCGLDRVGYKILCLLKQQGAFVVGISDRPISVEGIDVIVGDLQSAATLTKAGIREAHTLVLSGADEAVNLGVLMQARILNSRIRIINRLFNSSLGERLDQTLPDHVSMSGAALTAPVFAFTALDNLANRSHINTHTGVIGQLKLFNQTWPISEELIDESHPWRGKRLSELWEDRTRMLIYYLPTHEGEDLISAVIRGQVLRIGDRLLIGTQPSMRTAQKSLNQKVKKIFNQVKYFQHHTRSVLLVGLALMLTIFAATVTYTYFQFQVSLVDALYFSVGMITGAGGNEKVVENSPDAIKLFTTVMMLVGAAVIGIWYALLNDFILGTHLKQFWNAVRVPQDSHFVICGLGGIGIKTASQLHSYGYEVVVIERDPNNRFLHTARSLKIPVIIGDASVPAVLQSAHIGNAKALIAVTSNDTANLEIALNGKGVSAKIPVIVRYEDSHFAKMAQQVFDFESVLSPSEIVAPAFAAAALGGRVLGNGILADSLWVCLATMITANHPFCGKVVKDAAMSSDFVPLYVETKLQTIHGWDLLETYLSAGDVLYLTMPATRLEQLWRASPSEIIVAS